MADDRDRRDRDQDRISDPWLKKWEDQCLEELESGVNMDDRIQAESAEQASQKLWLSFQNSATAIAQMYKDRNECLSLWVPFQNAAHSVTLLYKDGVDCMRRSYDLGIQIGQQRKTRDIIAWAKKRRRHIRREELFAFLCGKTPPRHRPSPPRSRSSSHHHLAFDRANPVLPVVPEHREEEPDLHTFREALALQGLNGAMSNISVGYRQHTPGSPSVRGRSQNNVEELNCFIMDELSRHTDHPRKRTSGDHKLSDSPSRKRNRFF